MRGLAGLALFAFAAAGFAQGAPKDVPKDHWAYHAVDELFKVGLLVGYPDGAFRGDRPVSRFELAASLDSLDRVEEAQIQALSDALRPKTARGELGQLKDNLKSLQAELDSIQPDKSDLDSLKQSRTELQKELDDLRASLDQLKAELSKKH